jgi:hypothetical protein
MRLCGSYEQDGGEWSSYGQDDGESMVNYGQDGGKSTVIIHDGGKSFVFMGMMVMRVW